MAKQRIRAKLGLTHAQAGQPEGGSGSGSGYGYGPAPRRQEPTETPASEGRAMPFSEGPSSLVGYPVPIELRDPQRRPVALSPPRSDSPRERLRLGCVRCLRLSLLGVGCG